MLSRERVIQTIHHHKPDQIPLYGWVAGGMTNSIKEHFGSIAEFEDHYGFDLHHSFGGPVPFPWEETNRLRQKGAITPEMALDMPLPDPDSSQAYDSIRQEIIWYKEKRGRFVYIQTQGMFECLNALFGIENHLEYLALYPDEIKAIYERQAQWNTKFAMNCLDLGVDMIHISDDWGSQKSLLFNPKTWWKLIHPPLKSVCDAVKKRGAYLSLHSDGAINSIVDGIIDLGFDVVHPWQESAGMSLEKYKSTYREKFTVMGGLDVQNTLGFGRWDTLEKEIRRVSGLFYDGGLILCTTHFVSEHCSIEELVFAYDLILSLTRKD